MKRPCVIVLFVAAVLLAAGAAFAPLGSWLSAQTGQPLSASDPVVQLSDRFEAIATRVLPAVVSVEAIKPPRAVTNGKGKPVEESGTGIIVKLEGRAAHYVLTNNHVIAQARPEQITPRKSGPTRKATSPSWA
jgi:S1-C subfamily serine protease